MKKNYEVKITNGSAQVTVSVAAFSVQQALDLTTKAGEYVWGQNFKVISEDGKPIPDREIIYI